MHSILAVFAHPDDETSVGPMLARYAREGHAVYLVSVTSGQKGVRPDYGLAAGDELAAVRERELRCACRQLGVHEPFLLRFQDQGIASPPVTEEVAARLRELVDQTRADVVVTWGPDGITGHIDHRVTGDIATLVFQQQSLLRHRPRKLYYVALPESRLSGMPEPLRRGRLFYPVSDVFITTEVDCQDYVEAGLRAIECHKTQWEPERMKQMKDMYTRVFGGRAFLRLALSMVPHSNGRETSILAGLDGTPHDPC
jgi:LmbE family N-acetylglucosaminyl deacetylase